MPHYSEEFKEQTVRKMMPPNAMSVAQVSRDTSISGATLYNWRNRFRREGKAVPADPSNPESWSGKNKLAVIIETTALNEAELAEYCRAKGLYVEQIERWRESAIAGADTERPLSRAARREAQQDRKKIRLIAGIFTYLFKHTGEDRFRSVSGEEQLFRTFFHFL
jgi:transposase